tara:strand:- start:23295 stop:23438 length:144 start_codon:yes stop_codon:yes gene_type:complete
MKQIKEVWKLWEKNKSVKEICSIMALFPDECEKLIELGKHFSKQKKW